jgi:hypothetical protein
MDIDQYVRSHQIALAHEINRRKKIYLDLRFWIMVREVAAGNSHDALEQKLLNLLREGVSQEKIVCPISENTFMELMKQKNTSSRRSATANIIDELSLGAALIPIDMRVGTEIAHFIHSKASAADLHPVSELVWSKLIYVLGFVHPSLPELDPETELHAQKLFFEEVWNTPLSTMVEMIGDGEIPPSDRFDKLATYLNQKNVAHADELKSFAQVYKKELSGAIDIFGAVGADVLRSMAKAQGIEPPPPESAQAYALVNKCKNLLLRAFSKDGAKNALRTIHIHACLHANLRWNKNRQFEANDFHDFNHAAAALAYCDAFLTERSLRTLATAKNTNLESINGCRVTDNVVEAIQISPPCAEPRARLDRTKSGSQIRTTQYRSAFARRRRPWPRKEPIRIPCP